jgi:hypothetical protein
MVSAGNSSCPTGFAACERRLTTGAQLAKLPHKIALRLIQRTVGYLIPNCSRYVSYFEGS